MIDTWWWNTDQIQEISSTENVVDFMAQNMQALNAETQSVLKVVACVGNYFDLSVIALITNKSRESISLLNYSAR